LAAAGSGERLGAGGPKAFVEVAGRPLLAWSFDAFAAAETVSAMVVAAPPGDEERAAEIAENSPLEITVVPGADSRSGSVADAVAATDSELVVVHDAARPLVAPRLIDQVVRRLAATEGVAGVIAAAPVTDTLKEGSVSRRVIRTLDRSRVWAVQTPQAFRASRLVSAYSACNEAELREATDDAVLLERNGDDILLQEADQENLKVTTPLDLRVAELLLAARV
jgi:2-C-methyl-D-erythritol 4-phosphate cytidylyltransferase